VGTIKNSAFVKLIAGLIAAPGVLIEEVLEILAGRYGPIDVRSETIPFTFTDYYAPEMGNNLLRQWVAFERLVSPDALGDIKIATNGIENDFLLNNARQVNIDPGYLTQANLVLASTKEFSHRIYVGHGIYGEVTLIYKGKSFTPLPWTYPDYQSDAALRFLNAARSKYQLQLKEK